MKRVLMRTLTIVAALAMISPSLARAEHLVPPLHGFPSTYYTSTDIVESLGEKDGVQKDGLVSGGKSNGKGKGIGRRWLSRFAGGSFADLELNFMKYGKEAGVTNAAGVDGGFEYEIAPRLTLGFQSDSGMGVRTRLWDFSHTSNSNGSAVDDILVDAFVLDVELFERIDLNCHTSLEWSGGLRYTDFTEALGVGTGPRLPASTEAWGGVIGAQVNRCLGRGEIYARARAAMMLAYDGSRPGAGNTQFDMWTNQLEIGLGYELVREMRSGRLARLRVGYEWQDWEGFSNRGAVPGANNDVGFAGFVLGAGLDY